MPSPTRALLELITLPLFGWLADKVGRRPFYILGGLFTIAFAFPLFWMIDSKSTALIFIAIMIAMNFGHGMMFGPESCYFPELFGPRVRYTGASFGRILRLPVVGGDRWRLCADHRDCAGRLFRRHGRCVADDDRTRADHPCGRACRARD
jgi:hypothetical protein